METLDIIDNAIEQVAAANKHITAALQNIRGIKFAHQELNPSVLNLADMENLGLKVERDLLQVWRSLKNEPKVKTKA